MNLMKFTNKHKMKAYQNKSVLARQWGPSKDSQAHQKRSQMQNIKETPFYLSSIANCNYKF